eukprot:m.111390 g.111390  ORF g.111390 m.111390 type:complete len:63 (+) comp21366_c0_seq1:813-1001(+)
MTRQVPPEIDPRRRLDSALTMSTDWSLQQDGAVSEEALCIAVTAPRLRVVFEWNGPATLPES